ncbi:MAG: ABC transporter permease [Rhizobiaceae bacterium]|nr:ABC transporter permease [Rhizobiaceae bacterium]
MRLSERLRRAFAASYSLILVCLLWEAVAAAGLIREVFLPRLSVVLEQLYAMIADGSLAEPIAVSVARGAVGLALSVVVGSILGFLSARSRTVHLIVSPLLSIGQPLPKVALIPIFILWLGVYSSSKIALVFITCVFPIAISVQAAASAVPKVLLWSSRSLGASEFDVIRTVLLPASLSGLMSGLRVALPLALLATFTAEMIGGGGGVGAALMYSQRLFETPTVYAYLLVMLAMGIVLDQLFLRLRHRLLSWDEQK